METTLRTQPLGRHLLADLWGVDLTAAQIALPEALSEAARAAGATVVAVEGHRFTPEGAETAVALLAESHIAAHAWPEHRCLAIDIFMCGAADPDAALAALTAIYRPSDVDLTEIARGGFSETNDPNPRHRA